MNKLHWRAPEFDYYPKTRRWYYFLIFIALLILAFAIWQKNFLFAFFIVAAGVLILDRAGKKPETVEFSLDEKGLTIGTAKFYSYSELKAFAETDFPSAEPHLKELALYFKSGFKPTLFIKVPEESIKQVVSALSEKIERVEPDLSFFEVIERTIRF